MDPDTLIIALASGLVWGVADFWGGVLSRSVPAYTVAYWSQLGGAAALVVAVAMFGVEWSWRGYGIGALAGVSGGLSLIAFFRALSVGAMSIVTPVAACGVLLPVTVSLVRGDAIGGQTAAGMVLTGVGIGLVSVAHDATEHPRATNGEVVRLGLLSALGFGGFFTLLDLAAAQPGSGTLLAVIGSRSGSLVALTLVGVLAAARMRPPSARLLRWVVAAGLLDMTANALFAQASQHGAVGLVSLLGSTYPVMTVLLAWLVLHERLARIHRFGVALTLAGVLVLAAG